MLNKKIEEAINAQINAELWSAYLYLSMAAYCHAEGREGTANWYEIQFKEEQDHAKIFYNYVVARGGRVTLAPIDAVPTEWKSTLEVFEETDFATQSMLKWFIDEQVEEEENAQNIIDKLRMIGDNGYGQYMLDKELAARTYVQTAQLSGAE